MWTDLGSCCADMRTGSEAAEWERRDSGAGRGETLVPGRGTETDCRAGEATTPISSAAHGDTSHYTDFYYHLPD